MRAAVRSVVTVGEASLDLESSPGSITGRLAATLRSGIQSGRLVGGLPLPPSRTMAAELGCSRWVVTEVYAQLVGEGYLTAVPGSVTRVRQLPANTPRPPRADLLPPSRPRLDLLPGLPDLAAFPRERWAEAYRRAVRDMPTDLLGERSLLATVGARTVLTDYLRRTRQVQEDPTQLNLCTSSVAAAAWLARVLIRLGHRRIAVEDPSWPGLREAFRRAGLQPVGIEVDAQGLRVEELARRSDVRAVLVTPAHQYPTGVALSAERRLQLVDWAVEVDGLVIEDDYDAEFRYDRGPTASLQGMAPDQVLLLGSTAKTLSPALQLGWMVMPQWFIHRLVAPDLERGVSPSALTLEAFAIMISEGWYERHLRTTRLEYRRRRAALVAAIDDLLPDCRILGGAGGLHLPLRLPAHTDVDRLLREAAVADLPLDDLGSYRLTPRPQDRPGLVLGFGNLRTGREREAITRLAAALRRIQEAQPSIPRARTVLSAEPPS